MPNRWQAIIWNNADRIHWRIYAAPKGDELNAWELGNHQTSLNAKFHGCSIISISGERAGQSMVPLPSPPHASRHALYDDVTKWKHFPRYWPLMRGIHRSPVNPPHKGLQAHIKENIKAPRHWPLWWNWRVNCRTKGQYEENIFIWWRHHVHCFKKNDGEVSSTLRFTAKEGQSVSASNIMPQRRLVWYANMSHWPISF